jgi:hypothetical protein
VAASARAGPGCGFLAHSIVARSCRAGLCCQTRVRLSSGCPPCHLIVFLVTHCLLPLSLHLPLSPSIFFSSPAPPSSAHPFQPHRGSNGAPNTLLHTIVLTPSSFYSRCWSPLYCATHPEDSLPLSVVLHLEPTSASESEL